MEKNSILSIEKLSKSYDGKTFALLNCDFNLTKGKICAIVGESGSGKSTLLRLIAGLETPNQGTIKINGKIMSDDSLIVEPQKREVGLVFQDYALFPHLTVQQNISFGLKDNKQNQVEKLMSLIKMKSYEKSYPSELSGGQQQRVALARTLALNPKLLLLDEPFSNLDTGLKSELRKEIKGLVDEFGTSMIFITHDIMDAIDIADEIIFLKDGEIIRNCAMKDFAKKIENEDIKTLISDLKYNANRLLDFIN